MRSLNLSQHSGPNDWLWTLLGILGMGKKAVVAGCWDLCWILGVRLSASLIHGTPNHSLFAFTTRKRWRTSSIGGLR